MNILQQQLVESFNSIENKLNVSSEQLTKLTRFQFKSFQEGNARFEGLEQSITAIKRSDEELESVLMQVKRFEQREDYTVQLLFRWLDDIDHVSSTLPEEDAWQALLKQWSRQLLHSLAALDIVEIDVLHKTFDPRTSESVGTVTATTSLGKEDVPFQVVKVLKRGFARKGAHDSILRKVQVITTHKEE